ncbi:chromosome segregation protein SMC [Enterococcus phoeniculicola]|uniref:Chromosome partition protein Smc n=1 Tax=Enterococcus phoeniculicola ATCC BAA-412 TaxID=1158610 RepID=R3WC15_9ENTE|nr:chromosome segregation protein SMC [Enterococcus phoeniculicola]EOL45436.1 chromosome segregation protein SMC [Enterococcus phoeniculicola ATCC BAA-412]EOT74798.1 chromosome segregation protein SMC [Enterococcus phoeniculicola ATCC BAA-412]OJG73765.1 chromosome segregation protein SMC [Enterococcus phoeniculicola]
MYLKRLEIAGFKSFADRTVIDFENSVTAVVGPNGSGKSNITEAVRWVLGEQSAKSLRGGKMPDIIFAGSDSRKQLNIAEVTVILDNSDHYLPLDFNEISVTRRYNRNGDSDFFINKQSCRLKDIQDLFMDSGLGKESFSIISQGKVEAIFSSKPEDRRGIFEEAAGVLKYKQRKKKAEQKLFETEDNLSRVQDIIYELEDQLTPLAAQSEAAKEFLRLKESLTEADINLTVSEINTAKVYWEEHNQKLVELNEQLAQLNEGIRQSEQTLVSLRGKRGEMDQWTEHAQQQLLHLTEALKQAEGQKEVMIERSKHTLQSSKEYQENLQETAEKIQQLEMDILALEEEKEAKSVEVLKIESEIDQNERELIKYQKTSKELLEELRGQYVELMQEQASTGNELKHLERQYQQESSKNQQALSKHEELAKRNQQLEEKQQTVAANYESIKVELVQQREQYVEHQQQWKVAQQQLAEEQQTMYQLMSRVQQVRARQKSLQEIQENYSGFYQGVRMVLQQKDTLSGIVGAVAELIDVPADYTLAIETALGGAAQHVIVETEKDARQGITYLKQQRGGRATFLPLTTIKPRQMQVNTLQKANQISGFMGIASQLISFPEKISTIVENLLGTIIIAKDLSSANQIAQSINYQYRVVSLEGDVMNAGGSMTGGANKRGNQGSLFSQAQELQELATQYEQLDQQQQAREKRVRELEQKVAAFSEKVEKIRELGETARFKEQEVANQLQNITADLERIQKEQQLFSFETKELQNFIQQYEEQKQSLEKRQRELDEAREAIDKEIESISQESDLMEEKRQELTQEKARLTASLAVSKEQLANIQQQLQRADEQLTETVLKKESLSRQLEALTSDVSDHEVTEETLAIRVTELQEKRDEISEQLTARKSERMNVQGQVDELDKNLAELNRNQKQMLSDQTKIEVQKNRAEMKLDSGLQYLQEEYSLTFEAAAKQAEEIEENEIEETKQEVSRLKRSIERLGPVNLNAIEQYEQVNERHEFLVTQRDDLLSAKEQLFETMTEMDQEVKIRFSEVFEAIREKFKVVFPNMFGGGRAELVLTNPEDLLNTGIEIEAQPPGKKLQSLSLLSGGERALTAIALLFSIIQVRPVPFCILDEVEAALDDANVARFGHYLSQFQNDTQFIVVTHRKGTMEAANVLYGVTMQESGVSKIVSVRLEEVAEGGKIISAS